MGHDPEEFTLFDTILRKSQLTQPLETTQLDTTLREPHFDMVQMKSHTWTPSCENHTSGHHPTETTHFDTNLEKSRNLTPT